MAQARGFRRLLAVLVFSFISQTAMAQNTSTDPQVARDNAEAARLAAETALLNAQTANIKAKYGEPVKAPEGTISGQDKFGALAEWTHTSAINALGAGASDSLTTLLSGTECGGKPLYITSTADGRPARVVAKSIESQLKGMTSALKAETRAASSESVLNTGAMIKGTIGVLDSLVGLFRSDYSIVGLSTSADELALRFKIAELIAAADIKNAKQANTEYKSRTVDIDGLSRAPSGELSLMVVYREFDTALREAKERNKAQKDAKEKAALAATITSAEAFDKIISTQPATPNGQSPLVAASIALEAPSSKSCVLFATYSISTSTITRKRLLSRNDRIMTASGGQLKIALFSPDGTLLKATLIPLKHIGFVDLKSLKLTELPATP